MNIEQKKFKSIIKRRRISARHNRIEKQKQYVIRVMKNKLKHDWINENKEIKKKNLEQRLTLFKTLKSQLNVPNNVIYSLEQLISMAQTQKVRKQIT